MAKKNANKADIKNSIKTNHHIIPKVPIFNFSTPAE
jgi:hypothetical protein